MRPAGFICSLKLMGSLAWGVKLVSLVIPGERLHALGTS